MKGLLMKEFMILKKSIGSYLLLTVFFVFMALYMRSTFYIQGVLIISMSMQITSTMIYDSNSGWDKYVLTMPLNRRLIVLSKYVLTLLLLVAALLLGTGMSLVFTVVFSSIDATISSILGVSAALFLLLLFVYSILLPLIFKIGVEKSRIFMFLIIFIPVILVLEVVPALPEIVVEFANSHLILLAAGAAVILMAFYCASYFVSLSIYRKEEF